MLAILLAGGGGWYALQPRVETVQTTPVITAYPSQQFVVLNATGYVVAQRKAAIAAWAQHRVPPALGVVPDVIDDPAIVMLWGITRENLDSWLAGDGDDTGNELKGFAASSGVVEGPARVVTSAAEIGTLRQGEILVCQVTNPSWAPIFQKIAAAVSDIGGSMSHMAIVAREYGLPAVVGTGSATQRIRTGQRLRVDGGRGIVTILDEEEVAEHV